MEDYEDKANGLKEKPRFLYFFQVSEAELNKALVASWKQRAVFSTSSTCSLTDLIVGGVKGP